MVFDEGGEVCVEEMLQEGVARDEHEHEQCSRVDHEAAAESNSADDTHKHTPQRSD